MTGKVALYLDFENLAIPAREKYPSLEKPLDVSSVLDYATGHGNVLIKRAYADWSKKPCSLYVQDLMELAFDLVFIPHMTSNGKNAADLRMAMDTLDDLQSSSCIDTYIIGSGDTDFIHLIRKLQARGKTVAVVGFEGCVGHIVQKNCNEFRSIEDLMGDLPSEPEPRKPEGPEKQDDSGEEDLDEGSNGRDLIVRYIKSKDIRKPVLLSTMKQDLLRLDPSFSERKYCFGSFMNYIVSFEGDVLVRIDNDPHTGHPVAVLKSIDDLASAVNDVEVAQYLHSKLMYQHDQGLRRKIYAEALRAFKEKDKPSIEDIINELKERGIKLSKAKLRKFLYALGEGRLFRFPEGAEWRGNKNTMPQVLIEPTPSVEDIDPIYIQRVVDLIRNKFPGISVDRALRIMEGVKTENRQ